MAIFDASVKPAEPIMEIYVYDIGKIRADPQGAAEIVPRGWDWSGAGIPPVDTYNISTKNHIYEGVKYNWFSLFSFFNIVRRRQDIDIRRYWLIGYEFSTYHRMWW